MESEEDRPLFIDTRAMVATNVSPEALGAAMDLIAVVWWPSKLPFVFDEEELSQKLNAAFPARSYSADLLREHAAEVKTFFISEDGKFAPSPMYFSLTEPEEGEAS